MSLGMTDWLEIGCQRGCESHPTRTVHISLGGPTAYRDLTPIPNRFATEFDIEVWNTDLTPVDDDPRWCPAHDAVSETLIALGVWEPQGTTVMLLALEALGPGATLLDVGCQIGWFSKVASMFGVPSVAYEADPDVHQVALRNIPDGDVLEMRIGPDTEPAMFADGTDEWKTVMKIDIEGAEADAIRIHENVIDEGRVPFIIMEVSPCFGPGYPDLVTGLMDRDYAVYEMPPKQIPPVKIDRLADLDPYRLIGDFGEVWDEVASWTQKDVVMVKGGVGAWE